jgi:hypothetical protein
VRDKLPFEPLRLRTDDDLLPGRNRNPRIIGRNRRNPSL